MSNQITLRELAKDYASGSINKENYRKSRTELIAGIIDGKIPIKPIDFPAPKIPPEEDKVITKTVQRDREKTEIRPELAKKNSTVQQKNITASFAINEKKEKSKRLFFSTSTFIVILLTVLIILFYPRPKTQTPITPAKSAIVDARMSYSGNTAAMAGENLISDFLEQKNWSKENLDKFISSWLKLTKEEKNSAVRTKKMQRMNNSIYKQFLEEKALASINKEQAILKQKKLIQLAKTIGLNDSRLIID